jgi:enolase-phosphatase E1
VTAAIVLDVEGTTSSIESVTQQLFPYARERLAAWAHRADPQVASVLAEVREVAGRPDADPDEVAAILRDWLDADRKVPPLKTLQGLIWAEGFAAGELIGHIYPDVPPALRRWQDAGFELYVYSSGSVLAQRLWFTYSTAGDLSATFRGHFDTRSAGPKREPESYRRISAELGVPPGRTTFLSDVVAELDAARAAGWGTVLVRRADEPSTDTGSGSGSGSGDAGAAGHLTIGSFADLRHTPDRSGLALSTTAA